MQRDISSKGDFFLAIAVIAQYFLNVFQQCMVIWNVPHEIRVVSRIILSAIPVFCAMYFILKRKPLLFLKTYIIVSLILFFHSLLFPANVPFLLEESFLYLLPIALPTFLAIASVKDIRKFIKYIEYGSWATILLGLLYVIEYFRGTFVLETYNMVMGYGLLLPTLILYNKRTKLSLIGACFSFLTILSIGSRGSLVILLLFIFFDVFYTNKKYIPILLFTVFLAPIFLLVLSTYLNEIGISSRNIDILLSLFEHGHTKTLSDLERIRIKDTMYAAFQGNELLGLGVFGDRPVIGGYIHNIFYEVILNWGIIIGPIFIIYLFVYCFKVFIKLSKFYKINYVIFILSGLFPLFKSGSYLTDFSFYALLGLTYWFKNKKFLSN